MKNLLLLFMLIGIMLSCSDDDENDSSNNNPEVDVKLPKDHFFHDNENEWYYFSGKVETEEGKEFGVMFTIFQFKEDTGYRYPCMLAVSDIENSKFHDKRIESAPAIMETTPAGLPSIKVGDSQFIWEGEERLHITAKASTMDQSNISVELDMKPGKDILYHGENGFIPMGDGIPSGYYSLANLIPTNGKLTIDRAEYTITGGRIWADHQWGDWTSGGYRWDWFSLRFNDGSALMVFQFRDADNNPSIGNWTYRDKDNKLYYGTDFNIQAGRMYEDYPIDWKISLPSISASFTVKPMFDDQTFVRLWEGLCSVNGEIGDNSLTGHAFVELAGYSSR